MTGSQREAINIMMMMESVTVNADLIAQALGMNPGVLRKHVKDGEYLISKYEICGDRIRFFRKDFLQAIGEMPPDPEEPTDHQLLEEIHEALTDIRILLKAIANEKTAGAATPTAHERRSFHANI
jgi:hypothetical protein